MKARAVVTTKFEGKGYRPRVIDRVESYTVDSAMDTDADSWSMQLGFDDDLLAVLKRDAEVRVNLYAISDSILSLATGFTDEIAISDDGSLVLSGRDMTAVAVDSVAEPGKWKWVRPDQLVAKQARQLKIGDRLDLDKAPAQKNIYTDGSETYWEFWYRFYRRRAGWIWAEADGLIRAGKLNYDMAPVYKFGSSAGMKSSASRENWIPVESVTFTKTTQKRVGEVIMIGHRGTVPFIARSSDPTTRDWIKRPRKIIDNSNVKSQKEAIHELWEEIHESKIGSLEISLTVWNPGFIIRQNRMATVNIPKVGIRGTFFVVGAKTVGSTSGGVWQEIRLREKNYAISRRVPDDPKLSEDPSQAIASGLGANLGLPRQNWSDYFIQATQKFHGAWDFNLFCAVLLGICQHETGFRNVREGGNSEWYPRPDKSDYLSDQAKHSVQGVVDASKSSPATFQSDLAKWEDAFANSAGNPKNPYKREAGVGPMQLTTASYKDDADEMGNKKGELDGARWQPKFNIFSGAKAFAGKLSGLPINDNNIWDGVRRYNGDGPRAYAYMLTIKKDVEANWLPQIKLARQSSSQEAKTATQDIANTSKGLREEVLNNPLIEFSRASQKTDIQSGQIADEVLRGILLVVKNWYFTNNLRPNATITALKSDHDVNTSEGRVSAHSTGHAVDLGFYNPSNAAGPMAWMNKNRELLGFKQLIGPTDYLVYPKGIYDSKTLGEHDNHIHLGW
jgi:prophage tail gpP-like protein